MNTPLYKLADEYLAIAQLLADHDLPEEVIADTLEGASGDLEEKAWNVAALIQQSEGEAAMIKDAEQRMSQRRKSLEIPAGATGANRHHRNRQPRIRHSHPRKPAQDRDRRRGRYPEGVQSQGNHRHDPQG